MRSSRTIDNDYGKLKYELAHLIHYAAEALRFLEAEQHAKVEQEFSGLKAHAECVQEIYSHIKNKRNQTTQQQ